MIPAMLTEVLIFERSTETVGASGAPVFEWAELARIRAGVTAHASVEEQEQRGAVTVETATLRGRWCAANLSDRVIWRAKTFTITALSEIGRREGLEIKIRRTGP